MGRVFVEAVDKQYPIYIEKDFSGLKEAWVDNDLVGRKVCVVTDKNVSPIYLRQIVDLFEDSAIVVLPSGEQVKNLTSVSTLYNAFLTNRLDRTSVVVALGGGVVGDLAGFAAATYMRGIPYVQIPTTLLAQVDSSIGGKTGVDFEGEKNLVGAFYQPEFVWVNTATLSSLPYEQFSSGMAEVIKHGLIYDAGYYQQIWEKREDIKRLCPQALSQVIAGSCRIKAAVVAQDTKEAGVRRILNFGHTFGHAIESFLDFSVLHGHCVAIGMMAALYCSQKLGKITLEELQHAAGLLDFFGLPLTIKNLDKEDIYHKMFADKKTKNNQLHFILLNAVGEAYVENKLHKDQVLEGIVSCMASL